MVTISRNGTGQELAFEVVGGDMTEADMVSSVEPLWEVVDISAPAPAQTD